MLLERHENMARCTGRIMYTRTAGLIYPIGLVAFGQPLEYDVGRNPKFESPSLLSILRRRLIV